MRARKLNYWYRLTVARLVILRMRLNRRVQLGLSSRRFDTRNNDDSATSTSTSISISISILVGCAGLLALGLSAWGGYWLARTSDNVDGKRQSDLQAVASASLQLIALQATLADRETEYRLLENEVNEKAAEIDILLESESYLSRQLNLARDMKSALEEKLRVQELSFANARKQWLNSTTERKVVYNITNIPVGAHVSDAQYQRDVQAMDAVTETAETGMHALPEFVESFQSPPMDTDSLNVSPENISKYDSYSVSGDDVESMQDEEVVTATGYSDYDPPESDFDDLPASADFEDD